MSSCGLGREGGYELARGPGARGVVLPFHRFSNPWVSTGVLRGPRAFLLALYWNQRILEIQ